MTEAIILFALIVLGVVTYHIRAELRFRALIRALDRISLRGEVKTQHD